MKSFHNLQYKIEDLEPKVTASEAEYTRRGEVLKRKKVRGMYYP